MNARKTHLQHEWKGGRYPAARCLSCICPQYDRDAKLTTNPDEVTCRRCRRLAFLDVKVGTP